MEDPTSQKKTNKFANKVALRMSISQLERVIVALLNNSQNKKFATNVAQLFGQFDDESFASDFDKQVRVTIINRIADLIMMKKIDDKDGILSFIDLSGKYEEEATKILNKLFAYDIKAEELAELDSLISRQLKMAKIEPVVKKISDLNSQMETETYDDFSKFIEDYQQTIGDLNKGLIDARKSIEDASKIVPGNDARRVWFPAFAGL